MADSGIDTATAKQTNAEAARPTLRGLRRRWAQRRHSGRELARLARYAGGPLVGLTATVHAAAGLMPVAFLVGIGSALQRLHIDGDLGPAAPWLGLALGAFMTQHLLAPVQLLLSKQVARRVDTACIVRFTRFALQRAPLRTLERADVADRLSQVDEAFEQWTLTPGGALEGGLALVARYAQLGGAVAVLAVTAGALPSLTGAVVALVARFGQSEALFRWGQLIRSFLPLRRRLAYVRELATSTRAAKEIRTLGLVDWIDDRYTQETRAALDPLWTWRRRIYGVPFAAYTVVALAGTVAALVVLAWSGSAAGAESATVGHVAMAVQAVVLCARFGVLFPESDIKLVYGRSTWDALLEFEQSAQQAAAEDSVEERRAPPSTVPRPQQRISLVGVRFGYLPDQPVLCGLDLNLTVGTSTALVGVNGIGKTTLVKVLTGMYRPDEGRVEVDGTDLRDIDLRQWQHSFAITFQDYLRHEMSLRDNVAMGAIEHRDDSEGIRAELARVGLADLLDQLPAGLETPLTRSLPGGRDLSGGQWQRLALARSLFAVRHGASVLVLDEPTAQLDARGEAEFYDTFLDLTRGVTSMVISHRFSSVRRADRIVVLDDGRVSEAGTHDELVARGGTYARMFELQARRFAPVPN